MKNKIFFPAEWHEQSAILIVWAEQHTPWHYMLAEIEQSYIEIAKAITQNQKLLIVCSEEERIRKFFSSKENKNIICLNIKTNDTWIRDFGILTVMKADKAMLLDFGFNAWGLKFPANLDNQFNRRFVESYLLDKNILYRNKQNFILEGGSIETNGAGTILTTESCLSANNRNQPLTKKQIEYRLKKYFGAKQIQWLSNIKLEGDDTDGHIDTLARFCNQKTIAYVSCTDKEDINYFPLKRMETELKQMKRPEGENYNLIALPLPDAIFDEAGNRLPATYANFLITNKSVLLPVYKQKKDKDAIRILKKLFPERKIIPINSLSLIKEGGSIHCASMQLPVIVSLP